jgi:membrane glycosyltransferase
MSPFEILEAGRAKQNMWHLQNAVNANFFSSVLASLGVKTKEGDDIKREHLYLLPNEEAPKTAYIDSSTEEGRQRIREMIKKDKDG